MQISLRLANRAPVATDGMRPCTALKLCERLRKYAGVFDDVDDRQIAAHQVNELANTDGSRVAIAADTDSKELVIRQHRAGSHGWHTSVHGIKAVGTSHEVRRGLRGAADAAGLDDALGLDTHFVHGVDDALGNSIVAAAGT